MNRTISVILATVIMSAGGVAAADSMSMQTQPQGAMTQGAMDSGSSMDSGTMHAKTTHSGTAHGASMHDKGMKHKATHGTMTKEKSGNEMMMKQDKTNERM